jgi:hypothetical protein
MRFAMKSIYIKHNAVLSSASHWALRASEGVDEWPVHRAAANAVADGDGSDGADSYAEDHGANDRAGEARPRHRAVVVSRQR